jgi:sugar/nucleoside kinase (ribokinase family)
MKADIICIGIACADVLIRDVDLSTPFSGESKAAGQVALGIGGDATNQAIILTRLGVNVKLVCGIGRDSVGGFILNTLVSAGVDTRDMVYTEGSASCINVVVIDPAGQRNFINAGIPPSAMFRPEPGILKGARIVSLGSMMVPPFVTAESIVRVAGEAKANGSVVCADVVYNPGACSLKDIGEGLGAIDYIFPNEEEARLLTGKTVLDDMADVFLGFGVKNVVIKTGKEGCFVKNAGLRTIIPAYKVDAIDTTGAGDNFAAGFMAALLEGNSIEECCRFAAATAGIAVRSLGANTGVTSRRQVLDFIREHS